MTQIRTATRLLLLLARMRPELYDVIDDRLQVVSGPRPEPWRLAALNPQPLPPHELLFRAVQHTTTAAANAIATAGVLGGDPGAIAREIGDDWCPTPPRPPRSELVLPWPRHWPGPPPPPGDPYGPELVAAMHAKAAVTLQAYASGTADQAVSEAPGQLADRLDEAALAET